MRIASLWLSPALLFCAVSFVHAQSTSTDARLAPVLENVLVLHVPGEVSIPMFFRSDGQVYYVDLHLDEAGLKESYTRTVSWKVQGDELCVIKDDNAIPCFRLPQIKVGDVIDTKWRVLDGEGKVQEQGVGKLMLLPGRPPAAALGSG